MAKQTKIVAHVVDGIHRLTALECVLIGYQPPEADDYAVRLPHAETSLPIIATVPTKTELSDKDFINEMKRISSECQQSFGSLHPHSKKEFFAMLIQDLNEVCKPRRRGARQFFLMSDRFDDKMNVPFLEYFAKLIIRVICDKKYVQLYPMVPNMDLKNLMQKDEESWTVLFKKKNAHYSFLWDDGKLTL